MSCGIEAWVPGPGGLGASKSLHRRYLFASKISDLEGGFGEEPSRRRDIKHGQDPDGKCLCATNCGVASSALIGCQVRVSNQGRIPTSCPAVNRGLEDWDTRRWKTCGRPPCGSSCACRSPRGTQSVFKRR